MPDFELLTDWKHSKPEGFDGTVEDVVNEQYALHFNNKRYLLYRDSSLNKAIHAYNTHRLPQFSGLHTDIIARHGLTGFKVSVDDLKTGIIEPRWEYAGWTNHPTSSQSKVITYDQKDYLHLSSFGEF